MPSTETELTNLLAWAGLRSSTVTTFNPEDLFTFQEEASNDVTSVIGGSPRVLAKHNTPLYQQAVSGWTRDAITLDENTGDKFTSTISNGASFLGIFYVAVTTPSATRSIAELPNLRAELTSTPRFQANNGVDSPTTGTTSPGSSVHPLVIRSNAGASTLSVFTDVDKLTPNWQSTGGTTFTLGGTTGSTAPVSVLWGAIFTGANAQWSNLQIKTFLQKADWTVTWSP